MAQARRRSFRRGEVVFHRGDPADSLHLVVSGRFAVRITTPLGGSVIFDLVGPGEVFGELALVLPGRRRSVTVEALARSETRAVFYSDFAALQAAHPEVKDLLLELLGEQLQRLGDRLVEAHHVDAETRLRRRLLETAERFQGKGGKPLVSLTQEELASLAGTSRATANRVLRDEERHGTIDLSRGRALVLDLDRLRRRCRYHEAPVL